MNRRQKKKQAKNQPVYDCPRCKYFSQCMEQRGRCREFIDYEEIKEMVKNEIEGLNNSR